MAAAVDHYRAEPDRQPVLVGVEPSTANCVQASVEAGRIVTVPGPHHSMMVGLNCGTPSPLAWPTMVSGVDWFVSVEDDAAAAAMRQLAAIGVVAGETGAAALAGLTELLAADGQRAALGLGPEATALVIVTEGATDPVNYERILAGA